MKKVYIVSVSVILALMGIAFLAASAVEIVFALWGGVLLARGRKGRA